MRSHPFSFDISPGGDWRSQFDRHLERRLSAMDGYYADAGAYAYTDCAIDQAYRAVKELTANS